MRYPAAEKLEIIRTVETSPLPVRRTLAQIGIPKSTFYAWLDRYVSGGLEALEDRRPRPERVWNRIADEVRQKVIALALDQSELSPREVAVTFTDRERTFVSEASVYRLLQGRGPHHQPGLHPHESRRPLRQSDHRHQSALADRLHLPEGHRLGMVSISRPCSTTSRATSSPGSSAPPWPPPMSPTPWTWRCRPPGSISQT